MTLSFHHAPDRQSMLPDLSRPCPLVGQRIKQERSFDMLATSEIYWSPS